MEIEAENDDDVAREIDSVNASDAEDVIGPLLNDQNKQKEKQEKLVASKLHTFLDGVVDFVRGVKADD